MKFTTAFAVAAVLLCDGCVNYTPLPTSMNFDPQSMEYVGRVYAETSTGYILCFIPTSESSELSAALAVAVKAKGADAAINVLAEKESGAFLGLYCWRTNRISGVAIKFKPSAMATATPPEPTIPNGMPAGMPGVQPTH